MIHDLPAHTISDTNENVRAFTLVVCSISMEVRERVQVHNQHKSLAAYFLSPLTYHH
jgi:hypothetical protein